MGVLDELVISSDLSLEMSNQAAIFGLWANRAVEAKDALAKAEFALELLYAKLDTKYRQEVANSSDKTREKDILARIHSDPAWKSANDLVLKCQFAKNTLEATTEAWKMRAQMLSGLGAMRRAEIEQETALGTPAKKTSEINRKRANDALIEKFKSNLEKKREDDKP